MLFEIMRIFCRVLAFLTLVCYILMSFQVFNKFPFPHVSLRTFSTYEGGNFPVLESVLL